MDTTEILGLIGFLVAVMAAASTGAFFMPGEWYARLRKPGWTPPNWLFGPAWTVLYLAIAVAGWLVWKQVGLGPEIAAWTVSLLLNAAWSWIFFGLRRMDWAMGELVVFWLSIVVMILAFAPISPLAGQLLLPYLAWVTFAGALNFAIWQLNREDVAA